MVAALEEHTHDCPYCGESIVLLIDHTQGSQHYTEDCHICCQPILISIIAPFHPDEPIMIELQQENN